MVLTDKNIDLINRAERAHSQSKAVTVILIALVLTSIVLFYLALISSEQLAGICLVLTLLSIFLPRLRGPDYEELVALLIRVRADGVSLPKDPVIDALTRN